MNRPPPLACAAPPPPAPREVVVTVKNHGITYNQLRLHRYNTATSLMEAVRRLSPDLADVDLQLLARSVTSGTNNLSLSLSLSLSVCVYLFNIFL